MLSRREFIQQNTALMAGIYLRPLSANNERDDEDMIMTVNGPVRAADLRFTLSHEHVLVDFTGAGKPPVNYNIDEAFAIALPFLRDVKRKGCNSFVECTPAYLGRNPSLLRRLSTASGLQILTNTGYYGAVNEKYLPRHVYSELAEQIAARWIDEWKHGIDGTGIKPGFIKTSVDKFPFTPAQRKIIDAAALTHLATGLTIGIHTGDGAAAREQIEILKARAVAPSARIWIHAQNETNAAYHIEAAKQGSWVSFDGVKPDNVQAYIKFIQTMKGEGLLNFVLVSQDSGWYHVEEPGGGNYQDYNCIFDNFIPALKNKGFTKEEIAAIFVTNPAKAFTIKVRRL